MQSRSFPRALRTTPLFALSLALLACGSDDPVTGGNGGGSTDSSSKDGGAGNKDAGRDAKVSSGGGSGKDGSTPSLNDKTCTGLQCQQMDCAGGGTTSISGVVYDPAGRNPLYNIAVYVPNEPLDDLKSGASCDTCASLYTGSPVASALTDASGKFTLTNAPVGTKIPLVVQVGKWRRQFTIDNVASCTDNPQPDGSLRLPKNSQEGNIPKIAVSTGGADTLECLLRRVGVDASEFVPGGTDGGRIQIFQGTVGATNIFGINLAPNTNPAGPQSSVALWNSTDSLMQYDIVLLSCEGAETANMNQQALHDYTDAGGRVFASHFHYSWFNTGPYAGENLASWQTGSRDIGDKNGTKANIVTTLPDGTPFVKGQALSDWLGDVGALTNGELVIEDAKNNATVTKDNTPSQQWIVADQSSRAPGATQYFSFNTPVATVIADGASQVCGRVVYSDLHVGAASNDNPVLPVPSSCSDGELSPQEKALEFMLFDLSSCITPDTAPPAPPVVIAL